MTIDNINKSLAEVFSKEKPEGYERRIVFWHDSELEFEGMLDELELSDVRLLCITGDNYFEAKKTLAHDDTASDFLVYDTNPYKHAYDNWLRDIELYSEQFRADLVSIQMDELGMEQTTALRRAMKEYGRFFENKDRTAKLSALGSFYDSPGQLHIDIMAVLSGAKPNTPYAVIRTLLCAGLYEEDNRALEAIRRFGSEDALNSLLFRLTGYSDAELSLEGLAAHIMLTAFSEVGDASILLGLEQHISPEHAAACYALIDEWASSDDCGRLFDIAEDITARYELISRLEKLDIQKVLKYDSLPCFDECILSHFMNEIIKGVIKAADIINAAENRRTSRWADRFSIYYDGISYIAKMQEFYLEHITGFHYTDHRDLWRDYQEKLCIMDTYYRNFHASFRQSLISGGNEFDDLFKGLADTAEGLYKGWYLTELNANWCSLVRDNMQDGFSLFDIPQQKDFYKDYALPVSQSGSRAFVIISDALRFEVAAELNEHLIRETNGSAEISAVQSVFPSITKFGMAALLPHDELEMTDDIRMTCDGMSTEGTEKRQTVLDEALTGSCAVTYEALLAMKRDQRRELVSRAQVVYIYHNKIDAIGDESTTEHQVFEACKTAVDELTKLVRLIVNTMNGSNIIITSDHGFLYSYKPIGESEKADIKMINGELLESGRRYILADKQSSSEYLMRVPIGEFSDDIAAFAPLECIRIKKQGGGVNYVHGGISLQECCVPVISFKNARVGSKNFVDIKKAGIQLMSRTRKISNNIFGLDFLQTEAVGGKLVSAEYELYFADEFDNHVSDTQLIIADKTDSEPKNRTTRVRFTLKGMEFDPDAKYYLNIVMKETGSLTEQIEFSIKIAFANDFDF